MDAMMKAMRDGALALMFLPAILLKNLPTLYLQTTLGVVVASYIYWPDEKWLIFPLCVTIAATVFGLLTDIRSWIK